MTIGRQIFQCFGEKVEIFFSYTRHGSSFVFGDELVYKMAVFAFTILPVIIFFSFIVAILYYYGAMQWSITKIGWLLQTLVGSSLCESVVVAGNLGLGMTETPMLIRPYMKVMQTKSWRRPRFSKIFQDFHVILNHFRYTVFNEVRNSLGYGIGICHRFGNCISCIHIVWRRSISFDYVDSNGSASNIGLC